jgi:hypothetical protein
MDSSLEGPGQADAPGSGPRAAYGEKDRPWVHSVYEEDDEDAGETFSAWDLPVNSEAPRPKPEKVSAPVFKAPPVFRAEKETEAPPPSAGIPRPAVRFPENLAPLSPLQRAVVWAEILGPPKGM